MIESVGQCRYSLVLSLNNTLLNNNLLKIKEQSLEYPTTNIIGHLNINC